MTENTIHPDLESLSESLDALADAIVEGAPNNQSMQEIWGWQFPVINRDDLAKVPRDLSLSIRNHGPKTIDEATVHVIRELRARVERLEPNTTQNLWNGHGQFAAAALLMTLYCAKVTLEPLIGWQRIADSNLYPPKLARRLRAFQAQLDQIAPDYEKLSEQITAISNATQAAESLPTDLEALTQARVKVHKLELESALHHGQIGVALESSRANAQEIEQLHGVASKLVAQCEEAYRITTTKGLAAAFDEQARQLNQSMWVWVIGFVAALAIGSYAGTHRLDILLKSMNAVDGYSKSVWVNAIIALFSYAAPFWAAWLAVKQIRQRFRLGQDYGFKASIARAYEGYRKEAARIDPEFEARLFSSALTRLEEHPLRLVQEGVPSSPWHEFIQSEAFSEAIAKVPGLRDQYNKFMAKGNPKNATPADNISAVAKSTTVA